MNSLNVTLLSISDAENTFNYLQDDELYLYIPDVKYENIQQLRNRYQSLIDGSHNPNEEWMNWIIYSDFHKNYPIGTIQATVLKNEKKAYVGYVIYKKYWNQGYGYSALQWLENFLKEKDNVQYLEGYVDPRNIFSIKILEKSGFIKTHEEDNDYVYRKQIK
ncbi:GNAT family N-acetyltransferase [Acinetobacter pittii]|uniref:GNAT family N-acetyltransferase n=1 Tax=Acinetobacter pittii TaxID=48296 RepID=UPI000A362A90|nr:GNAT family protein [Acinetobacter pittii]OTU36410.1 GNAT family N-acetyltransferase [Acinetobacter pittii]